MAEKFEKKKVRYNPKTASDTLTPHKDNVAPVDDAAAEDAGVVAVAYLDYDEALKNYEGRDDVETLANRRARHNGTSYAENDHHRQKPKKEELFDDGTVTATPTRQTQSDEKSSAKK